jgi:predicted transcriptional regulator
VSSGLAASICRLTAELEILTVLWSRGPSTVREVHEAIAARRPAQYTTILKFLQIMAEKGLVRRDEKNCAHVYHATRARQWTERQLLCQSLKFIPATDGTSY